MTGIVMGSGGSGTSSLPRLSNPAAAGHILQGREAIDGKGNKISGSIVSKTAATYVPGSRPQVIPAGQYLSGDQTIEAVPGYSERVHISRSDTISRNVGFRPRRISILRNSSTGVEEHQLICCRYDEELENGNSTAWCVIEDHGIGASTGLVSWEITGSGFTVSCEDSSWGEFEGYYYIHATP